MPFLAAAAVLAASYGAGMLATAGGRIGVAEELRRHATVFALGFGLLGLLALLLGSSGAFERTPFEWIAVGFAVPGAVLLAAQARRLPAAWRRAGRGRWVLVAVAALVVVDAVLASAPPTSADAIAYHLVAPKLWFEHGGMFPIWWDWTTFGPFFAEMHYAYAIALQGARAAMVVGAGLSGFSALCVYGLGRRLAGPAAGAWAAAIWVGQGMFLWEATGAFVEALLAGFVALAAWHLAAFARSGRWVDCAWSGLALGLAIGTKYHALVLVPGFLAVAVWVAPGGLRRRLAAAGGLAALLAVGVPWYVRNLVETGNPFYPLFFGGRYWDANVRRVFREMFTTFGVRQWFLPVFPLEFVLRTDRYERGYSFSPALFALAPLAPFLVRRRWAWLLGGASVAYALVWWTGMHQITRYLLPILPLAAVLAAVAGLELWGRGRWPRALAGVVAAVTAVALVAMTGLFGWRLLPGVFGTESSAAFVQSQTGTYDALHWLDRQLPPGGRVLIGLRNLYWLRRPYVRFTEPLFTYYDSTAKVVGRMHRYDVRYLAFYQGLLPASLRGRTPLRLLTVLRVPEVESRSLHRVTLRLLYVYAWCAGRGHPCAPGSRPRSSG